MKYHALIGKFMGIWPSKKCILIWINALWKVNGKLDLKLGSKGFFTTIFTDTSDQEIVSEKGPYFFNFVNLHMRYWFERFSLEKENFTEALI